MTCGPDDEPIGGGATNLDGFVAERHRLPGALVLRLAEVAHVLDEEVLHVGLQVRQPPRDVGVASDDDPGKAGKRRTNRIDAAAAHVRQIPDHRQLGGQVRVVGENRPTGGRA